MFLMRHLVSGLYYLLKSQERSRETINRLRSSQTYEHYSVRTEKIGNVLFRSLLTITSNILSGVLCSVHPRDLSHI